MNIGDAVHVISDVAARQECTRLRVEVERLTAELAQCRRDYRTYVDGVRTAEQAEIERLTAELAAAHRLDDNLRVHFNNRTCPIELAIAIDEYRQVRYAASTAERGEG